MLRSAFKERRSLVRRICFAPDGLVRLLDLADLGKQSKFSCLTFNEKRRLLAETSAADWRPPLLVSYFRLLAKMEMRFANALDGSA